MPLGPLKKDSPSVPLYDADFHRWTEEQGRAVRERRASEIDWENVAEEIESLGRSDKRSIESNLGVILLHLLKWQSGQRKAGWRSSILEHRSRVLKLIEESPSLRTYPQQVLRHEYDLARAKAADETELPQDRYPKICPFTIEQILSQDFLPEAEGE